MNADQLFSYIVDADWLLILTCVMMVTTAAVIVFSRDAQPGPPDRHP
ncbi:MAG TPA: hypothetical protein VGF08_12705 [Terriglobales bacterium]|jgi:hypothetical protein